MKPSVGPCAHPRDPTACRGADGRPQSLGGRGIRLPAVPGWYACPPLTLPRDLAAFAAHLDNRPATDARPLGGGERAELLAWIRFVDRRPLDAEALVVLADALPPALFALWTVPRPVPTAELTVHFTDALDVAPAEGWALVRIPSTPAAVGPSTTAPSGPPPAGCLPSPARRVPCAMASGPCTRTDEPRLHRRPSLTCRARLGGGSSPKPGTG